MKPQVEFIGLSFMLLSLVHLVFPRYFKWADELPKLSLVNKQLMEVHTFFIALMVMLNGLLCFFYAEELISSYLGKAICLGLAVFWSVRAVFQFFVYSPKLWKGKTFETIVHIIFSIYWLYVSSIFWILYLN